MLFLGELSGPGDGANLSSKRAEIVPTVKASGANQKALHSDQSKVNGRSAQRLSVETNIRPQHAIGPQKIDGMPIVTSWQPGASTASRLKVRNSRDGIPIVTAGQLMLD